jgi:hypothetical protein
LYRLLTFHVPNAISLFRCAGRTKVSIQARGKCSCFVTKPVFTVRSCQHLAKPQAGRLPLVGCPRLLIQYIRSYPPYWRPFLQPQPEDAPCPGDPLITEPPLYPLFKPTPVECGCLLQLLEIQKLMPHHSVYY